ncbi:MAG: putative bifunctional type leader peptidase/N-methyltransferase, partial [Clostridiales bacterium]|nr:putative bifunctional type leader peptidase/N-methyltransferase [Clostridiales bacterium]
SYPPSHCTSCGTRIKPYDLFPVFSYIFLSGRCRSCGVKISIRYPFVEFLVGLLFLALYITYGVSFELLKFMILIPFIIVIGLIDLETTDVYFKTTLSGSLAGLILLFIGYYLGLGFWKYIFGALLGAGIITLIVILTRGMGWGDVEICLLCGIYLGLRLTLLMLFISFVLGGVIGLLLIILKKKSSKDYIPFGPFITLAALFCIFFGEKLISWYFSLF